MPAELSPISRRLSVQDFVVLFAVSETGSFRKAATQLNINQSAVTRRIQKLENALGVSLFERSQSGSRLTNAGISFVDQTRKIIDDLQAAIRYANASGVARNGSLFIGLIASLSRGALMNVVTAFRHRHPHVDLHFIEAERSELFTHLSHRVIDVVVAAGELDNKACDTLLLAREKTYLAVPQASALTKRDRLSWDEVVEETFLVSSDEPGRELHDYIIRRASDLGRQVHVRRHRIGREGIMSLVSMGVGVSLIFGQWRDVDYPNVVFVPIGSDDELVPFSVLWLAENDNPALRRFVSLARMEARKNGVASEASQSRDRSS